MEKINVNIYNETDLNVCYSHLRQIAYSYKFLTVPTRLVNFSFSRKYLNSLVILIVEYQNDEKVINKLFKIDSITYNFDLIFNTSITSFPLKLVVIEFVK